MGAASSPFSGEDYGVIIIDVGVGLVRLTVVVVLEGQKRMGKGQGGDRFTMPLPTLAPW